MENKKKRFRISRIRREPHWNMKQPHYHEDHEIYYLISGERNFLLNENIFHVKKGDLVIIPKGELHRSTYYADSGHERFAMVFEEGFMEPLYEAFGKEEVEQFMTASYIHIPDSRREYVEGILQRLMYESDGIDNMSNYLISVYFQELFMFIMRCKKNGIGDQKIDVADEIIQNSAKYIYANYDKALQLDDVARKFGMSSSYFSKKFKAITGFGFKEYLTSVRIKEASNLLLNTDRCITDIAISCGFNDSNYFGDAFRKAKGQSPNKYRKNKGFI